MHMDSCGLANEPGRHAIVMPIGRANDERPRRLIDFVFEAMQSRKPVHGKVSLLPRASDVEVSPQRRIRLQRKRGAGRHHHSIPSNLDGALLKRGGGTQTWMHCKVARGRVCEVSSRAPGLYTSKVPKYLATSFCARKYAKQRNVQLSWCYARDEPCLPDDRGLRRKR